MSGWWISGGGLTLKRQYRSVHRDPACFMLRDRIEVPAEYVRWLPPCAKCVTEGRWYPSRERPPVGLGRWWREATDNNPPPVQ